MKISTNIIVLLFPIAFIAVLIIAAFWPPKIDKPQVPAAVIPEFDQMTPQAHLMKAKEILPYWKEEFSFTDIRDIRHHLNAIPKEATEAKEAQILTQRINKKEAELKEKLAIEEKQGPLNARKDFARSYESECLNKGIDATVTTLGADHTTLRIKFVLINRPFAHQFNNDNDVKSRLIALGFNKVILTDGFDSTWTIEL